MDPVDRATLAFLVVFIAGPLLMAIIAGLRQG
jgi:hypothetical protein